MREIFFKRSAVHNLVINNLNPTCAPGEVSEGLVVPGNILEKADIEPWEQVIVTKISGDNWVNRIKTFVIKGENNGKIEARGSLTSFFQKGDLICLITRTLLDEKEIVGYEKDLIPIFDLGFDPERNVDNIDSRLDIEFCTKKDRDVKNYAEFDESRKELRRIYLSSLVLDMRINKVHPDCLQGSAELPGIIMEKAEMKKYQSVSVYNASFGGVADTYAVPMPPGVVMTTGAMAKFAKIGDCVNIATYVVETRRVNPVIVFTDGSEYSMTAELA